MLPPSIRMSPGESTPDRVVMVSSVGVPAGSINQTTLAAALCLWFGLWAALPKEWLSVAWLVAGLVQVALGLAVGGLYIRRFGLGVVSLVVFKAFLFDFPELGGVVRIVSFLALGGVLLGVSYCYYKYRDLIVKHL